MENRPLIRRKNLHVKEGTNLAHFRQLFKINGANVPMVSPNTMQDEKTGRLAALSGQEHAAYKWLYEGYSESWTAETLGLKRSDAKRLFRSIYKKLGVENQRGIIQKYALRELDFM